MAEMKKQLNSIFAINQTIIYTNDTATRHRHTYTWLYFLPVLSFLFLLLYLNLVLVICWLDVQTTRGLHVCSLAMMIKQTCSISSLPQTHCIAKKYKWDS